jgi:hypothetical protein
MQNVDLRGILAFMHFKFWTVILIFDFLILNFL